MKICARCGQPLKEEDAKPVDVDRPTGPGMTLYIHTWLCTALPQQTAPVSEREPTRGR